jgi:hypothetical protein
MLDVLIATTGRSHDADDARLDAHPSARASRFDLRHGVRVDRLTVNKAESRDERLHAPWSLFLSHSTVRTALRVPWQASDISRVSPLRRARYLRDRRTPSRWLARSQRRQQLAMLRMAPQPEQMLAERLVACVVYIGRALAEQPLPRGHGDRQRRAALHVLGLSFVRTARGLLGLIALGYPDQATMLLRRLLELGVGLRDVLDDDQPGAAHEWLSRRRTKHSKRRLAKYHLDPLHQPLSNLLHGGPDAYFIMHRELAGELPTGPFLGAEVDVARLLVASMAAEFAERLLEQLRNAGWSEGPAGPRWILPPASFLNCRLSCTCKRPRCARAIRPSNGVVGAGRRVDNRYPPPTGRRSPSAPSATGRLAVNRG